MSEDFWKFVINGTLTVVSGAIAAYFARQAKKSGEEAKRSAGEANVNAFEAKQQGARNNAELKEIHHKVNGGMEERVLRARLEFAPQILLVDDDENDLVQMDLILKKFGAKVLTCHTADEARNLVQSRVGSGRGLPFDVAIVDLRLQASDAGDVIQVFEEIAPWVPVAIITGQVRPDVLENVSKIRPPILLNKPLDEAMAEKLLRLLHIPFTKKG